MRAKYLGNEHRREPEEISEVIGAIIEDARIDVDVRHGAVVDDWGAFAPGDWTLGTPVGVKDGTLLVEVSDGAVASLLRFQIPMLVATIDERFGAGVVTDVRLSVARGRSAGFSRE